MRHLAIDERLLWPSESFSLQERSMTQADPSLEATIHQAARLVLAAEYVTALTGAGISVESGIPPFRGPGGLWTKYGEPPMDGYQRFLADPRQAWEERLAPTGVSQEIRETIARAEPNPGHSALVKLEELGVLRWLITQNVDNLHRRAGSRNVLEIHGNSTLVRCLNCTARFPMAVISFEVLPPRCLQCRGVLKKTPWPLASRFLATYWSSAGVLLSTVIV